MKSQEKDNSSEEYRLDQTKSAAKWFDEQRGAEAEAYTYEEAEARRKEANE